MLFYKTQAFSTELVEYQDFPIFFVSYEETNGYLLDKDHRQQAKEIIELPRSVKGLGRLSRHYAGSSCVKYGITEAIRQYHPKSH